LFEYNIVHGTSLSHGLVASFPPLPGLGNVDLHQQRAQVFVRLLATYTNSKWIRFRLRLRCQSITHGRSRSSANILTWTKRRIKWCSVERTTPH